MEKNLPLKQINETLKPTLLLIACALQVVMMTSCLGRSRFVEEQQSPDGKYKAELVEGDTGAVGGWMSVVRVSELRPSFMARLLSSDRRTVFGVDLRSTHVKFQWKTDGKLEVTCSGCDPSKVEVKETAWRGVGIVYEFN